MRRWKHAVLTSCDGCRCGGNCVSCGTDIPQNNIAIQLLADGALAGLEMMLVAAGGGRDGSAVSGWRRMR